MFTPATRRCSIIAYRTRIGIGVRVAGACFPLLTAAACSTSSSAVSADADGGTAPGDDAGGMVIGADAGGDARGLTDGQTPTADASDTCANGKQDGNETGIDCGGSCPPCAVNYLLNPPDPCKNQFYVSGCTTGVAGSTCGGQCTVANACSPPEDPGKAPLPKTFACPRTMLFAPEMTHAAADDATANGWGSAADPAFNYAVAGHDPDTGGIDTGVTSTCCQCYQLVFELPESGSPQPPTLPIPKPLIVQSMNTAAGGAMNFDIFMGAGGFGAFNACVNDPSFGNTTKFNEFMYTSFPTDNPTNGGVKFLDMDACKTSGNATMASLQSSACQSGIATLCNEATATGPQTVTDATRESCIASNSFASLYHQNWNVRAKKVECPANLTRVTGCQLAPTGLPKPDPNVKTAADADSSWKSGYTTTTMQDCCKPTCAWKDNVAGKGLTANGPWTSFYSCDANGAPLTMP